MAPSDAHVLSTEIVDAPVPIVRVDGELDISTVAQLARALSEFLRVTDSVEAAGRRLAARP